jgi:hypothetical protein
MVRVSGPDPRKVIYDILSIAGVVDEIVYTWNADGTLATETYKKGGQTILTLSYTWNADGTLQKVTRS